MSGEDGCYVYSSLFGERESNTSEPFMEVCYDGLSSLVGNELQPVSAYPLRVLLNLLRRETMRPNNQILQLRLSHHRHVGLGCQQCSTGRLSTRLTICSPSWYR